MGRVEIEPASIGRLQEATDGTLVYIDADVGGVAAELKRLDPCLRLAHNPDVDDCWIVYRSHRDGQPIRPDDMEPGACHELVGSYKQLDHRIVKRLEYTNPQGRSGYDFAKALEDRRKERERRQQQERHEHFGQTAELMAFALRKDLGLGPYRGRIFKPRDI